MKDKEAFANYTSSTQNEWLETNGLGGWSGSSLCGCNTRRYHGLLMAAIKPPAERMLLVSKLDETIILDGKRFELSTNNYGTAIAPEGFEFISSFNRLLFPEWIYDLENIRISKTITMLNGENTTLIRYKVLKSPMYFSMEFLPLIAARGYHSLQNASANIYWDVIFQNGIFRNQPFAGAPEIFISIPGSTYQSRNQWFYHFNYDIDQYRGQEFEEDLFNHGIFTVQLKEGDVLDILLSTENPSGRNTNALFEGETERKKGLQHNVQNPLLQQLNQAADQFIVIRELTDLNGTGIPATLKTIIAGYHWFTDWSRDTMISLPGLCLNTGRFEDAKKILSVFAKSVSMGMLPNRFQDNNEPPEYNNVDGTLWFFIAIHFYLQATDDSKFILDEILPVLKDIMDWHFKGTRYNIHMDHDGLLFAGEKGQQLTWMDARIGDWVVTPRMGKPVEIQALWYNALKIFEVLLLQNGEAAAANKMHQQAEETKVNFNSKFWYKDGRYLFDNIDENGIHDASLRPNQVFAISLPYTLIEKEKAVAVLKAMTSKLYVPVGLRSLSPDDPRYIGHYGGNAFKRDSSYHEGTVWSWLLGPYLEAGMKTEGESFRPFAKSIIQRFAYHLNEGCIGTVSEIFDGDAPHHPRGCVAQAWGVSEILRVVKSFNL